MATKISDVWDTMTFIDQLDITSRSSLFHWHSNIYIYTHMFCFFRPHSAPNHVINSNFLDIHETVISKAESCSRRCSTTLFGGQKTMNKHALQTRRLPNMQSNSRLRGKYGTARAQIERSTGSHCQKNDADI